MNNYVAITIVDNDQDFLLLITVPDIEHRVTVGEAILNLDYIFADNDYIECQNRELEKTKLYFDEGVPKASQICMWAKSVVVLNEAEYQHMISSIKTENGVTQTIN